MDVYRITFRKVESYYAKHFDTTLSKANHFHVRKNGKRIGESSRLYKAVKLIFDDFGGNSALELFMLQAHVYEKRNPLYECTEITFSEKDGIKMVMSINGDV
jgi:hypothetical protein